MPCSERGSIRDCARPCLGSVAVPWEPLLSAFLCWGRCWISIYGGLALLSYVAFIGLFPGAFVGGLFWEEDESV